MPARNFRNHRAGNKRLFNHPGLVVCRDPPAPALSRDNLKPARRRCLRLKRMVERRHNTISDSEIVTITDRKHQEKVRSKHRLLLTCVERRSFPPARGRIPSHAAENEQSGWVPALTILAQGLR